MRRSGPGIALRAGMSRLGMDLIMSVHLSSFGSLALQGAGVLLVLTLR